MYYTCDNSFWSKFILPSSLFTEVPNCQSSFGRAGGFYQNNHESEFRLSAFVFLCLASLNDFVSEVDSL